MVNSGAKGARVERRAIDYLRRQGFDVYRCIRNRYGLNNDVFSCDVIAKKFGYRTRWIQVTTTKVGIGRKVKALADHPWDPEFDSVEVWTWDQDQQHFNIRRMDNAYKLGEVITP